MCLGEFEIGIRRACATAASSFRKSGEPTSSSSSLSYTCEVKSAEFKDRSHARRHASVMISANISAKLSRRLRSDPARDRVHTDSDHEHLPTARRDRRAGDHPRLVGGFQLRDRPRSSEIGADRPPRSAPEISRDRAEIACGSGSPVRELSSTFTSAPDRSMPSHGMFALVCALNESTSPTTIPSSSTSMGTPRRRTTFLFDSAPRGRGVSFPLSHSGRADGVRAWGHLRAFELLRERAE